MNEKKKKETNNETPYKSFSLCIMLYQQPDRNKIFYVHIYLTIYTIRKVNLLKDWYLAGFFFQFENYYL